ncbi:autotransporter outer membrane beta-barrel domain-containing protein [Serratia sp. RJAL6]|nr:autotransporter outer membrane beta-barrel domain-containing protein [Enterobacter sp. RJAL6]
MRWPVLVDHYREHKETNGTLVQGVGEDNVQTRLGVRVFMNGKSHLDKGTSREFEPFVEANWIYNTRQFGARLNGVETVSYGTRNAGELKVGVEGKLSNNLNVWGNVAQQMGGKGYSDSQAMLGVKYMF